MTIAEFDADGVLVACGGCAMKNRLAYARLAAPVRCGKCKQPLSAPDTPIELRSAADFDRFVSKASLPIVVDFWAPWCGPCRMVAPELQKVATRQAGRLLVVKVNTDELPDLGQRFNIRSIPTMAVFANGREVARRSGAMPAHEIEAFAAQATTAKPA